MATGTVKWFNDEKGYGFITQDQGPDVFVQHNEISEGEPGRKSLREGQRVEYEVVPGDKGPKATGVKSLKE